MHLKFEFLSWNSFVKKKKHFKIVTDNKLAHLTVSIVCDDVEMRWKKVYISFHIINTHIFSYNINSHSVYSANKKLFYSLGCGITFSCGCWLGLDIFSILHIYIDIFFFVFNFFLYFYLMSFFFLYICSYLGWINSLLF